MLTRRLQSFRTKPLLKKYVMDQVFTEMENSQSAIAPYYAGDIVMMMENNEDLDYAMPENGSNLSMTQCVFLLAVKTKRMPKIH